MNYRYPPINVFLNTTAIFLISVMGCRRPAPPKPVEQSADRVLRLYNWEEYLSPELADKFKEETGVTVVMDTFETTNEFMAKIKSDPSRCDLLIMDDSSIDALIELKLIRKLDHSQLPGLKNIAPKYLNQAFDPGNQYSVPYLWGTTLLAYRKDKVSEVPRSWDALWDKRYADHIMMIDDTQDAFAVALLRLGFSINTAVPEQLDAAKNGLLAQAPLVSRYTDIIDIRDSLISGDCWISLLYSGDAVAGAMEQPEIGYVIPEEGAVMWLDNFAIARDAPNVEDAHRFLEFLLDPVNAAANANNLGCVTANAAAKPHITEPFSSDPQLYPPTSVLEKCGFLTKLDQMRLRVMNAGWLEIRKQLKTIDSRPPKDQGRWLDAE